MAKPKLAIRLAVLVVAIAITSQVSAAYFDDSFDPTLRDIFEQISGAETDRALVGTQHTARLSLKFVSDSHIIFHDAYLNSAPNEKYQFGKWQFEPEIVQAFIDRADIEIDVTFVIEDVKISQQYLALPHIVARIVAVRE